MSRLVDDHRNNDDVLVVTHGGILQHILGVLMGTSRTWGVHVRNTAVFEFEIDLVSWGLDGDHRLNTSHARIARFNDASHLDALDGRNDATSLRRMKCASV